MKKFNKIFLSLALVLVLAIPMLAGCEFKMGKKLLAIDVDGEIKTQFYLNEELNLNETKVKLIYDDNSIVKIPLDSSMITDFDTTTLGNKKFTITYQEITREVSYTVDAIKLGKFVFDKIRYYKNNSVVYTDTTSYNNGFLFNARPQGKYIDNGQVVEDSSINWEYQTDNVITGTFQIGHNEFGGFTFNVISETSLEQRINTSGTIQGHEYDRYVMFYNYVYES